MNTTKKLTTASIMSSLFVVCTIALVSSGIGYALYLDFIVPVFFTIVCLKCDLKYSVLSGISSLIIVGLVLGNLGTAIWATQSVVLGILCGILLNSDTTMKDDLVYGAIISVLFMVLIDIYASNLIGYSFMKEFQGYIKYFKNKDIANTIYYMFVALYPFGSMFSIYFLALVSANKLNILSGNSKKKYNIIRNFRNYSRFISCSKNVFYACSLYFVVAQILKFINFNISSVYLKTILISVKYLCAYFIISDGFIIIQNYTVSKYKKVSYARYLTILTLILLLVVFNIAVLAIIILNIILDKKISIRLQQVDIVNRLVNQ